MAFGFQGPISDSSTAPGVGDHGLVDYALARAYRILSADRNRIIAACKVCGKALHRDQGHKVLISGLVLSTPKACYVCRVCFTPIKAAAESFPLFDPLPSWWKILDRKSAAPGESSPTTSVVPATEIERMIQQREKRKGSK